MGAQFENNGSFCGRVAYTKDGGLNWSYSESIITFGNETAFEGGVSEATILEREDGTLVFFARCQSAGVDNFAQSYSLDHGVTWLTPGVASSIYTTNTQALMMTYDFDGFDGNRLTGSPIFMWGGNNVLGGSSYIRMPMNFAVSTNGMDTFRNIQNIFSETFMDVFDFEADHYITNPSVQQINEDNVYMSFSRLRVNDSIYMVVNNFTDWFTRTKGAYDSFEHGVSEYEGWVVQKGEVLAVNDANRASQGNYSMLVRENTNVGRTVPYLQNGQLSIDLYVDAKSSFVFELQPAFSMTQMKCAVISAQVSGTTMTFHDGTVLTLVEGWNTVAFDLELTNYAASVSLNGGAEKTLTVNCVFNGNTFDKSGTVYDLGNYITYVTILASSDVYVDEFFVESYLDAVTEATEADEAAANAVIEQIEAIGEIDPDNVTDSDIEKIRLARRAYDALTQVQKDLVNRRVPTGTSTNANDTDALINYYNVLVAAEKAIAGKLPGFSGYLNLGYSIVQNVIIPACIDITADTKIVVTYADGTPVTGITVKDVAGIGTVIRRNVNADKMTEKITIVILDGNGEPLTQTLTTSVQDYAMNLINSTDPKATAVAKAMIIRMLDYGAMAQKFRNPAETDLANNQVTKEHRTTYLDNEYFKKADEDFTFESNRVTGLFNVSLSLNETIDMNLYVQESRLASGEPITVSLNGKELSADKYELTKLPDGTIRIRYGFNAAQMTDMLSVTVTTDSGDVKTLSLSIRDYAMRMMSAEYNYQGSDREILFAMLIAMLDYGTLAQYYVAGENGTVTDPANKFVTEEQRAILDGYLNP